MPPLSAELSGKHDVGLPAEAAREGAADWMGRGAWLVSGILAAAVVLALVIWEPERYADSESGQGQAVLGTVGASGSLSPTVVHLAEARVVAGAPVSRAGERLAAGAALREDDELRLARGACLRVEPAMRVCASRESEVSLQVLAGALRVFELHDGELWLDARVSGDVRLVVRHHALRVTAAQASFGFDAAPGAAQVRVARGEVTVSRHHEREELKAGQGARYDESSGLRVFALDEVGRKRLTRVRRTSAGGAAVRAVAAPPQAARPEAASPAPESGEPLLEPPETGEAEIAAPAPVPPSSPDLPPTPAESGAALALAHAQALREAQRYAEADAAFARLVTQHPASPSARQAAVELGDLRLRQRDDALAALGAYRTFMKDPVPGPLDARARLGVVAALRRLNRFAQERKAIEDFVARYPGSPQVPKLEARRTFLGGS